MRSHESSGSALGVLWECSESFMRALRVYLGLYLIFQANLADCMRYSLRNGGLPRRQIWIWRVFWYCGVGKLAPLGSHHIFCMVFFFHTFCKRGGKLAPLGTRANRVLRARVSFSLKVESLRDEHPEVRKRLGSFESASRGPRAAAQTKRAHREP